LFKERRKKQWAIEIGIDWMDGMALTLEQINTFIDKPESELKSMLDDLVTKGYLKFEHPKKLVKEQTQSGVRTYRDYDTTKPKGYNIVTGKLSFEINKILDKPIFYLGYDVIILWFSLTDGYRKYTQANIYELIHMDTDGFWIKSKNDNEVSYIGNDTENVFDLSIDENFSKIVISMYEDNEGDK
jgi:hypothetical protein